MSATPSASSTRPEPSVPDFSLPKSSRILRRADFRRVYDEGARFSGPLFAAFYLRNTHPDRPPGPRVGFTVPRAIGKAVFRNRVRRRVREAVRLQLANAGPLWDIIINPRRPAADAPFEAVQAEIRKLIQRCA